MKSFKTILLFILASIISLPIYAQIGDFYLTHYQPAHANFDNANYAIMQDIRGQMCFANKQGVLKFDGRSWHLNPTPSSVLHLASDEPTGSLWIGCRYGIGYIKTNATGNEEYIEIANYIHHTRQIIIVGDFVFFLHDNGIAQISLKTFQIVREIPKTTDQNFRTLFAHRTTLFAQDINGKWWEWLNNDFKPFDIPVITDFIAFAKRTPAQDKTIIGTVNGKLFYFDGKTLNSIKTEADDYLAESGLKNLILTDNQTVVIGTRRGGCVVLDFNTQKIKGYINYNTGLPDDEVLAVGTDKSKGIWIAHEFGLTRADYELPIRNYSNFPGLSGNLYAATWFENTLYVGTNEGVFYLSEVKDYAEIKKFIQQRKAQQFAQKANTPAEEGVSLSNTLPEVTVKTSKLKGLLTSIFGSKDEKQTTDRASRKQLREEKRKEKREKKKNKDKKNNDIDKIVAQEEQEPRQTPTTQSKTLSSAIPAENIYTKEKNATSKATVQSLQDELYISEVVLKSISYSYQKVKGLEGKCMQLVNCNGELVAITNKGIYHIQKDKATKITSLSAIYGYWSSQNKLWLSTQDEKVYLYEYKQSKWQQIQQLTDVNDYINSILEDKDGNMWLSGTDNLIQCKQVENKWAINSELDIYNPFGDEITLLNYDSKMYAVLSRQAYYYHAVGDSMILDSLFSQKLSRSVGFLASQPDIYWAQEKRDWVVYSAKTDVKTSMYLRLFRNVSEIFSQNNGNTIWVITGHNKIYQLDLSQQTDYKHEYDVFLRDVRAEDGKSLSVQQLNFDHNNSSISFFFSVPDYLDDSSTEFQYRLIGLNDAWTDWSGDNATIAFNYLPIGDYQLEVRARNSLGQIMESDPIRFTVNPPYWKEPWFYAAELLFFSSLLLLSFKLNRTNSVNKFISKALTYLTLILIVDFLNIIVSSFLEFDDSPVILFSTQCLVSLMIFPLEKVLEKFIVKKD